MGIEKRIFSVGPDELDFYDFERIEHYINVKNIIYGFYAYHAETYSGNGDIIIFCKNGYVFESLSHCSCYGPCENTDYEIQPYSKFNIKNFSCIENDLKNGWNKELHTFYNILLIEVKGYLP